METKDAVVEVLISAMNQTDLSLIESSNIESDALLINQGDTEDTFEEIRTYGRIRSISTKQRGLSKSRNMALENAQGDICVFADDDEQFCEGYADLIRKAYEEYPKADVMCFRFTGGKKNFFKKPKKVGYIKALRISSLQVSFKREAVLSKEIRFDERFGAGTPVGSGEENIFLYDCLKNGLQIRYVPVCISHVEQDGSSWFRGFDDEYFIKRGIVIKRLLGGFFGTFYCLYFCVSKYKRYKENLSFGKAFCMLHRGMREDPDKFGK